MIFIVPASYVASGDHAACAVWTPDSTSPRSMAGLTVVASGGGQHFGRAF
jgi:hypothetical protein